MGLGQYNSLGEYCDPHTASSVFLIFIFYPIVVLKVMVVSLLLSVVSILPSHVKRTATSQCLLVLRVEGHIKASLIRFHFQQMVSSININPIIAHGLLSKALQDHSPSRNIFNVARLHTIQTKRAARSASSSLGNCWRS